MHTARDSSPPWDGADLPFGVYQIGVLLSTLVGALLRIAHIARPFNRLMAWNEGHYGMIALNFDKYGLWSQHNELGVDRTFPPGVPWLIWASMKLFGPTDAAARVPIVIAGVAAIPLLAAFARRLMRSEQVALAAAAFTAVAPGLVYFSQNVQLDTPTICCAVAAAVFMLRYRDGRRRADAIWAGVWLTVAIWFKVTTALLYPAFLALWWPARPARRTTAALAAFSFGALTALPSVLWIVNGWLAFTTSSGFTKRFFFRDWDFRGISKAVAEIPLAVEAHLFIAIFVLMVVGIGAAVRWPGQFRAIWVWCAPWLLLYLFAPWDSLVNRYYDLPGTYVLTIVAAAGLWLWATRGARRHQTAGAPAPAPLNGAAVRSLAVALAVVVVFTVAYDVWDPMMDRVARASMAHAPAIDPTPFYSARIVAALPRGRTIVDTPQTMFYAGGDPAWIEITGGDTRFMIDGQRYDYVILNDYGHGQEPYYEITASLRGQLAKAHYVQIAPTAWAHARTEVADLGGYRDPAVPYWSPAAKGLRPGLTEWR